MKDPLAEAVNVLNRAQHRGVRTWHYDQHQRRVMPFEWTEAEYPPIFTAFEAVTLAHALVTIGAVTPEHEGNSECAQS
jgi:hypothetical protein